MTDTQTPPDFAEIKRQHAIGMGHAMMGAPWRQEGALTTHRTPKDYGMDYEDTRLPAIIDNCQIAAWYIPKDGSKRLAIVGHQTWTPANKSGMLENHTDGRLQIAIDYVKLHKVLHDAGFHVLAYDLRNHGESEHKLPSGYGMVEYRDAAGVMDWVNGHENLKSCEVLLLPFCASGNAFLKANSLYPEKFTNVKAWATTNIFQASKMTYDNPTPFNPQHKGFFNADDINGGFKTVFDEHVEKKDIVDTTDIAPFTIDRMSCKLYSADVKQPVLFCDPKNDTGFNHVNDAPETFATFPNKDSEFHWIGTDQEGPFKTETDNRCEGYNFYQSENGKGVLLGFVDKHFS